MDTVQWHGNDDVDTVQWHGTDDVDSELSIELVSECGDRASSSPC